MAVTRCYGVLAFVLAATGCALGAGPPAYRWDEQGNRLPAGAVARLGGLSFLHLHPVERVALSSGRHKLAVVTGSAWPGASGVWLWDAASGRLDGRFLLAPQGRRRNTGLLFNAARDPIRGLAYAPGGGFLAVAYHERIDVVDPTTGQTIRRFAVPGQVVRVYPDVHKPRGRVTRAGLAIQGW
jgi:hypothetical protein